LQAYSLIILSFLVKYFGIRNSRANSRAKPLTKPSRGKFGYDIDTPLSGGRWATQAGIRWATQAGIRWATQAGIRWAARRHLAKVNYPFLCGGLDTIKVCT
jgi:hypothetical protein